MLITKKKSYLLGASALFVLMFTLAFFAFSSLGLRGNANAEGTATAQMRVGVREVISIAIDADDVSFSLTPEFADTKSGTFGMSSTTVKVYTNSDGYKLYMSNKDANNSLSHAESSITDKISSLTVAATGIDDTDSTDSFPVNSWGYTLDTGTTKDYSAIPTSTVLLKSATLLTASEYAELTSGTKPSASDFPATDGGPDSDKPQTTTQDDYDKLISTTVTFGAKVNTSIASGKYNDIIVFDVTGSNVGPEKPGTSVSDGHWVQTAYVFAEDTDPLHDIATYEYYIVKSDKAYTTSDADLRSDAGAKAPTDSTTESGSVTAGCYDDSMMGNPGDPTTRRCSGSIVFSGDSSLSSSGTSYADGIYYVYVRSIDSNGYTSGWADAQVIKLDNTKPAAPTINRTDHDTFNYTTSDNVAPTQYIAIPCVIDDYHTRQSCIDHADANPPFLSDAAWDVVKSQDISSANKQIWFVYARDEAGNISDYNTIESFKVTFSNTNTDMTAKYESASGTAITLDTNPKSVFALDGTPIYVDAKEKTGYTGFTLTWNGTDMTNKTAKNVTSDTDIVANATTSGPTDLEVHKKTGSYKHIQYSANDDVAVTGYYVATGASAPADPNPDASGWTTVQEKEVTGAGTYWVWAKDGVGNVTGPVSINVYEVDRVGDDNAVSSAHYETATGDAWSTTNNFVVSGTRIYVTGVANTDWTLFSLSCGGNVAHVGTDASYVHDCTANKKIEFNAKATDQTSPSVVTFAQTDYNKVTLSSTDKLNNVTKFFVSDSDVSATLDKDTPGWITPDAIGKTSTYSYTFTDAKKYYFWAMDKDGNVSSVADKTAHTLTITPDTSKISVKYNGTSTTDVAKDITTETTRIVIDDSSLTITASANTNYTLFRAKIGPTANFNASTEDFTSGSTDILSNIKTGSYSTTMPSADTKIFVKSTDQTKPVITITRSTYNSFSINAQDAVGVTDYCVVYNTSSADSSASCTWVPISPASTNKTIPYNLPVNNAEYYWHVYAKDAAGNVSEEKNIRSYLVKNQQATHSTLSVRLESNDTANPEIASGSSMYALAGTPIYVAASADQNWFLDYVCRSTTTTACTTGNLVNKTANYLLDGTTYVFATAYEGVLDVLTTMQQMNTAICTRTATNTQKNLTDERDGHIYVVKKLADGNCWMIQNLALFGGQTISSTLSNVSSNYTLPSSSTSGFTKNSGQLNMENGSYTAGSTSSYGSYYNWRVANARTASESISAGVNHTYNICAKAWTLPTKTQGSQVIASLGGIDNENVASNSSALNAFFPGYGGCYEAGKRFNTDNSSFYWSQTSYDTERMWTLELTKSTNRFYMHGPDTSSNYSTIHYGFQARCLAK